MTTEGRGGEPPIEPGEPQAGAGEPSDVTEPVIVPVTPSSEDVPPSIPDAIPPGAIGAAAAGAGAAAAGAGASPPAGPPPSSPILSADVGPSGSGWVAPPPTALGQFDPPSDYPIDVRFDHGQRIGRLWAVPFIGWFFRWLVVIPHFVILWFWAILMFFAILVTWIPILLLGRFPGWGFTIIGGFYRYSMRVSTYLYLMVGDYPPIASIGPGYPVEVEFEDRPMNRLWGIPILGMIVRSILAIPHFFVLWFLGFIAGLVILVAWIAVLVTGRYPELGYTIVGGFLRYSTRVACYCLLFPAPYPPFRLSP